jgi:hypothetical protein
MDATAAFRKREPSPEPGEAAAASGGEKGPSPPDAMDVDEPGKVITPQKRVKRNPLVRKRLILAAVDECADKLQSLHVDGKDVADVLISDSAPDKSLASDCGVSVTAELDRGEMPDEQQRAVRTESRRVAAVRKQKPDDPDMPFWKSALAGPAREHWLVAMGKEAEALRAHGTFTLVYLPAGKKAISGKWVFKIKRGPTGEIERYKARYVARGFTQVQGEDFFETWSPVGCYATLRVLLAIAAEEDLEIRHVDIQCAFLNGELKEQVYVEQPPLFGDGTARVWLLHKTLYGLKQAAREWHNALVRILAELDFVCAHADSGLYVRKHGRCFIFLWVDDLFIFSRCDGLQELVDIILEKFEGRDLGELSWALGSEIMRDRTAKTITVTQRTKINNLLEKYGMEHCRKSPTPMVPRQQLRSLKECPELEKASAAEHSRFMSAVGSIQYIASVTRPDLSFAAHALARHMSASAKEHWQAALHVMRYLQSTKNLGITFGGSENKSLVEAYTDADFANASDCKSVSGMVIRVYGSCVVWRSKRQDTIASDTTEAEIIAMTSAAKELMWVKKLLVDLNMRPERPILWGDNRSADILATNAVSSDRSKHIRVKHLKVREYVRLDEIVVEWIGTLDMLADVMTKVLPGPAMQLVRDKFQLRECS